MSVKSSEIKWSGYSVNVWLILDVQSILAFENNTYSEF